MQLLPNLKQIKAGEQFLLDGKIMVTVLKSFPRSLMKCLVELPDTTFQLVEPARLRKV
jgi:hypothetical protein